MQRSNVTNVDGLASISHLNISTQMQEIMSMVLAEAVRGHVVLFPALSIGSEGFNSCFRPWVLPVQLWLEMVPMHSA